MSGISAASVNDYGGKYANTNTTVKTPEKTNLQDNVVHVDEQGNFNKADMKGAIANAKDGFIFTKNDKGEITKLDLKSDPNFITNTLTSLAENKNFSLKPLPNGLMDLAPQVLDTKARDYSVS